MTKDECVNVVEGEHLFPLDVVKMGRAFLGFVKIKKPSLELEREFGIIIDSIEKFFKARIDDEMREANIGANGSVSLYLRDLYRLYSRMLEILTRDKASGGYGYCDSCAKRMIEYYCTTPEVWK